MNFRCHITLLYTFYFVILVHSGQWFRYAVTDTTTHNLAYAISQRNMEGKKHQDKNHAHPNGVVCRIHFYLITWYRYCRFVYFHVPYFPVLEPGLEWAPGQQRTFWSQALKKMSLKWAPGHRKFEINEHSGKYGIGVVYIWWLGSSSFACNVLSWLQVHAFCHLLILWVA